MWQSVVLGDQKFRQSLLDGATRSSARPLCLKDSKVQYVAIPF